MGNPLLTFWANLFERDDDERRLRRATLRIAARHPRRSS
jgi:voltage-gated potassium channel